MKETNFKHTDIGLIPNDWEVKKLGNISDIKTGPFGSALHASDYVTDGTPIITVEHIGKFNISSTKEIPKVGADDRIRLKAYMLKEDDIVFSRVGAVDRCSYVSNVESGWLFSGRLLRVRPKEYVDSKYLVHHLSSDAARNRVLSVAVGLAMPSINTKILEGISVVLPSLDEQRRIAEALQDIDQLLDAMDAQIAKKQAIKTGAMQQLLTGKTRLTGFNKPWVKKYLWEVTIWDKRFNEVENYKQPETIKYPYALAQELFAMEDNNGDVFLLSTGTYVGWTTEQKAGSFLCEGEIVSIPWGGFANVKYTKGKFVTADNRIATSNNLQILTNKFLYFALLIRTELLNSFYRGAGLKHPSMDDVLNMEIEIPSSIEEQVQITDILCNMDLEIQALQDERNKYALIKQGMMQELLTGKTRI